MKPYLDSKQPPVRLVAFSGSTVDWNDFKPYWKGEMFLDREKKNLWPLLQSKTQGLFSGAISYLFGGQVSKNFADLKESASDIKDKQSGDDGTRLGGLWVLNEKGIFYEFLD